MLTFKKPPTDRYQRLCIPMGWHSARPYWFDWRRRDRLTLEFKFTDSCRYEQAPPDNTDWEKLAGLSYNLFTNHQNSVMVSWRYNADEDKIQLGVYTHLDGARKIFENPAKVALGLPVKETVIFARVPIDYPVAVHFDQMNKGDRPQNRVAVSIVLNSITSYVEVPFNIGIGRKSRVINPYIGRGGREALQDTYILRKSIS